jgi:hypothetical protein
MNYQLIFLTLQVVGTYTLACDRFILVFVAYTFIIYQQLMGGLRRHYANKSLTNFTETLEAFLTAISYNFFCWLREHEQVFVEA